MTVDPRHQARKVALLKLYSEFFGGTGDVPEELLDDMPQTAQADLELVATLVEGVKTNLQTIDGIITICAPEWPLDRIAKLDLTVLRIALFELTVAKINAGVAINEAVELAKEFGGENSSKFVNGVLGTAADKTEDHEKY